MFIRYPNATISQSVVWSNNFPSLCDSVWCSFLAYDFLIVDQPFYQGVSISLNFKIDIKSTISTWGLILQYRAVRFIIQNSFLCYQWYDMAMHWLLREAPHSISDSFDLLFQHFFFGMISQIIPIFKSYLNWIDLLKGKILLCLKFFRYLHRDCPVWWTFSTCITITGMGSFLLNSFLLNKERSADLYLETAVRLWSNSGHTASIFLSRISPTWHFCPTLKHFIISAICW